MYKKSALGLLVGELECVQEVVLSTPCTVCACRYTVVFNSKCTKYACRCTGVYTVHRGALCVVVGVLACTLFKDV